jgi:hypothetical protein
MNCAVLMSSLIVASLLTATPVFAAEQQQQSVLPGALTGPGTHECSDYLESRPISAQGPVTLDDLFLSWARGFMSGLNLMRLVSGLNSKQLSSTPAADQIERMRAYCVAHPNELYMVAVHDLFDSLPELPGSAGTFGRMGKGK